ncbi:MAG: universal stress protein [Rubricoccaceae bacterium]
MSIQHILVPTDFSHPAMKAVHYAARLAEALGARLTLLHVCNTGRMHYHLSWASTGLHVEEMAEDEDARTRLQRLASPLNARGVQTHVAVVGPAETIPSILEAATHADVVVLASQTWTGRQPDEESISIAIAHEAPCPVLLVDVATSLRTTGLLVLVPTDLSEASAVALRLARELTAALGGRVEVVHALPDASEAATWGGEPVEADDDLPEARRHRYLERFVEAAGGALVPIELRLVEGPPVDAIARVAQEDHPDLVVVGRPADRPDAPDSLLDAAMAAAPCPTLRAPSP